MQRNPCRHIQTMDQQISSQHTTQKQRGDGRNGGKRNAQRERGTERKANTIGESKHQNTCTHDRQSEDNDNINEKKATNSKVQTDTHTNIRRDRQAHTCRHVPKHTQTHRHTQTDTDTNTYTHKIAYTHTDKHANNQQYIHNKHTCAHARTHPYTHIRT